MDNQTSLSRLVGICTIDDEAGASISTIHEKMRRRSKDRRAKLKRLLYSSSEQIKDLEQFISNEASSINTPETQSKRSEFGRANRRAKEILAASAKRAAIDPRAAPKWTLNFENAFQEYRKGVRARHAFKLFIFSRTFRCLCQTARRRNSTVLQHRRPRGKKIHSVHNDTCKVSQQHYAVAEHVVASAYLEDRESVLKHWSSLRSEYLASKRDSEAQGRSKARSRSILPAKKPKARRRKIPLTSEAYREQCGGSDRMNVHRALSRMRQNQRKIVSVGGGTFLISDSRKGKRKALKAAALTFQRFYRGAISRRYARAIKMLYDFIFVHFHAKLVNRNAHAHAPHGSLCSRGIEILLGRLGMRIIDAKSLMPQMNKSKECEFVTHSQFIHWWSIHGWKRWQCAEGDICRMIRTYNGAVSMLASFQVDKVLKTTVCLQARFRGFCARKYIKSLAKLHLFIREQFYQANGRRRSVIGTVTGFMFRDSACGLLISLRLAKTKRRAAAMLIFEGQGRGATITYATFIRWFKRNGDAKLASLKWLLGESKRLERVIDEARSVK